ncbi:MAG TPA: hypothetical protein VN181_10385 [Thermoanaerobaculia bacterium]|nr:hypothetical protein [Thermoanaerobaculia bacterium]
MLVSLVAVQVAAQPYVFRRGDRTRAVTTDILEEPSVHSLLETKDDFFWIRQDGREYVVRDARTLAEIDATFEPMRALGDEKRAVKERVRPLRQHVKSLQRELRDEDDSAARSRLERSLAAAERELRDAEAEQQHLIARRQQVSREADAKVFAIFERALRNGLAVAR